ncbi:cytidine deaminase [Candidatus Woesearchaeota archaeon]|nr:cytidine deaminase [Candidatus Woesearchaeota archaeon]
MALEEIAKKPSFKKGKIEDLEPWQKELVEAAKEARKHAVPPYSEYYVGAAVLAESGKIYQGANYESALYTPTVHAEMMAIDKAIFEGEREFKALACYVGEGPGVPCGLCRQKIYEAGDSMEVIGANEKGEIIITKIEDLLPFGFSAKHLGVDISKY